MVSPARWSHRTRLVLWLLTFAALMGLNYGSALLAGGRREMRADVLYDWRTTVTDLLAYGVMLAIVFALTAGTSPRVTLALRRPLSIPRALVLTPLVEVAWIVVALALVALVGTVGRELAVPRYEDPARSAQFAVNALLTAVAVPFVEEALARGVGFWLLGQYGAPVAVIVTGTLFGLAHGVVRDLPAILTLGLGLSFLRASTGSLYPGLALHVFQNTIAVLASRS